MSDHAVVVTQVADTQSHALEDDQAVGRGDASRRPDGRIVVSIDSWQDAVFDRFADVMLADLPKPPRGARDDRATDQRGARR